MSTKSRLAALERRLVRDRPPRKMTVEECLAILGGGVYRSAWIREQRGIRDPYSEEIDREYGGIESLPREPIRFDPRKIESVPDEAQPA